MRSNERGDSCTHPVRPPYPNNCLIRGRQVHRALESGRAEVDDKGIKGVFPVEDAVDDAAEGELVVGEEEAQALSKLDNMISAARAGSERCASMTAQQEALQRQLSQLSQAAAVA